MFILQIGRFQNRSDRNHTPYRGCSSRSKFNYHDQVRHHGWDSRYAGGTYVPHQTYGPTIPAGEPLHQPQPVAYCKLCDVKVGSYKNVEAHNNGKRHRRMLNLHKELQRSRVSNGQAPNSQMNLAVQSMTVMKSRENGCPRKNVNSEATIAKHKNYIQKDIQVTSEIPAEGKLRDNAGAQGHGFKHNIGGARTGKYMKTNDGVRRPMESSKLDNYSSSDSALTPQPAVTSHVMAPTPVVGSSFKPQYQHVSASQRLVLIDKEYRDCGAKNMSSEASVSKHKNYQYRNMGQSSEVPARVPKGKLRENSGAQDRDFRHKSRGAKTGNYIKTNDGERRSMESSKININYLSKSVESPVQNSTPALTPLPGPVASQIMVPILGVGLGFEPEFQHVPAAQIHVSEDKEHHVIQNPTAELTDQKHVPADSQVMSFDPTAGTNDQPQSTSVELRAHAVSEISIQTEDVTSDSSGMTIGPASLVSVPPAAVESSFEAQIQDVLHIEKERQLSKDTADCESQNCTDDKNNQLLLSVVVEFNSCSGSSTDFQTGDECSKDEQNIDILTNQTRTTQLSQVFLIY